MSTFNDLLIAIGIDTKPAMEKIKELDKEFDKLGKTFSSATNKKPPKDPFNIGSERVKMQKYIKEMKDLGAETDDYQKRLKKLSKPEHFKQMKKDLSAYKKDFLKFKDAESADNLRNAKEAIAQQQRVATKKEQEFNAVQDAIDSRLKAASKREEDLTKLSISKNKGAAKEKSDLEDLRLKKAKDVNKSITKEQDKVTRSAKDSAEVFKQSFKEQITGKKKLTQAEINHNNKLKQQEVLKKKLNALNIKPKYDPLDSISKQNTALQRQINHYDKLEKKANDAAQAIRMSSGYQGMDLGGKRRVESRISQAQSDFKMTGDPHVFKALNKDVNAFKRSLIGLQTVQGGLADSTKNMVRAYASLFALIEGTAAIKNIGMDFQGMQASMLAASGSTAAAAKDMVYINGIVDKMGLNLKDTTDAFVKFKFAAKGKIDQGQQEDLFESLSMFGTALKVDSEAMKRSQKAIIQMMSKGKVMAEELSYCFITVFGSFQWKH